MIKLRPYQQEVAAAVLESVQKREGQTLSVEIARQGGKNELSALLELTLLTMHLGRGGTLIKASPTFKPQTVISMQRLKERLDDYGFAGIWRSEMGYMVSLGAARAVFLSADVSSNVVGHTADILLEMDEAQDIGKEKYTKEFRPMGAATNCTNVLYGTTWDDTTLLEEVKQTNLELERKDGRRRHFRYDWQEVAKYNPHYREYVLKERERLGENHPLFRTQYALLPVQGGGRLLGPLQLAQLRGPHPRRHEPRSGGFYIAGIDLAGEETSDHLAGRPGRDATAIAIAAVSGVSAPRADTSGDGEGHSLPDATGVWGLAPNLNVVELYTWTGRKHHELYPQMVDILKNVWSCRRIVVDATGMGEPVASFLAKVLGSKVHPFKFTQHSKSELGFNLLASINSGRLKLFEGDGSAEYGEALRQLEKARAEYRPNQTMNFYVDPSDGHDDLLMSLALVVEAARDYAPKVARGGMRHE
jgi:hypothetical protein